jgi:cytochrome c peroxidase
MRLLFTTSFLLILLYSCQQNNEVQKTDFISAQNYYVSHLEQAIFYMDSLTKIDNPATLKQIYFQSKRHYKLSEAYAAYLNPEAGTRVNGPPLPIYKEDNGKVMAPVGYQTIAETVFANSLDQEALAYQTSITLGYLDNLLKNVKERELTPERFFFAAHDQLLRILALGITGFDTPTTFKGVEESALSLEGFLEVYEMSVSENVISKNESLNKAIKESIDRAIVYLNNSKDFDQFDRYEFIREYFNPITRNWAQLNATMALWEPVDYKPLNFVAPTFFEENSFNVKYFESPNNREADSATMILGEKLFFDARLSKSGKMACATCHSPDKAFADGLKTPIGNDGMPLLRNTPTLVNSIFNKSFFWDGRSGKLESQITNVFTEKREYNTTVHEISIEILEDVAYKTLFKETGKTPRSNNDIIKSISSYVATLNGFNSKFDKNMRNEENTFTSQEIEGMRLYMGKALCATCHFVPLMNGTVPPFYSETEKEVIGVPATAENEELDADLGFYSFFKEDLHKGMFKTPTVRNAELTAPYMHNGVYTDLNQVMDFYNNGGGGGMGFDLPHQTLPFDSLSLNDSEIESIIAFMKTLTDADVQKSKKSTAKEFLTLSK